MDVEALAAKIIKAASGQGRFIVAVAGPPGAGKSTLAEALHDALGRQGEQSAVVPMDGFHLDNRILQQRNLLERKGAPETFDVDGFAHLLSRLNDADRDVHIPVFDRSRDCAIAGASTVSSKDRILLVEGNYLLLNEEPWQQLRPYFRQTVFLNPGIDVLKRRLINRWLEHGLDTAAAEQRAMSNDIPNAERVLAGSGNADLLIETFSR